MANSLISMAYLDPDTSLLFFASFLNKFAAMCPKLFLPQMSNFPKILVQDFQVFSSNP